MHTRPIFTCTLLAILTGACATSERDSAALASERGNAAPPAAVELGWYAQAQADSGAALYTGACQACHGEKLQGGAGPALAGPQFFARYGGDSVGKLWVAVHDRMPLSAPGSIPAPQSLDILAYILRKNGFAAGAARSVERYGMSRIIPAAAGGAVASANDDVVRQPSTTAPSAEELTIADTSASDWLTYGKGYRNNRYSPLAEITSDNVGSLRQVCSVPMGEEGSFQTGPVVYDGVIYLTTTHLTLAVDATTCAVRWRHEYVSSALEAAHNNKGVAIAGGRVIRGTTDGHLIALDAKTGALLWNRKIMNSKVTEAAIAAPLIWKDLVFMGKAGGDFGIRGEVMAYRVADGTKVWGFVTVPSGTDVGADSWSASSANQGGGAVWTYFSLDPVTATLLVPVGNPYPDFNGAARSGKNLFTTGIVALDAGTGKLKWWYQMQGNDVHDWDATGSAVFAAHGRTLVAGTGKDGYVHLLDAASGAFLTKTLVTTRLNETLPISTVPTRFCPGTAGGVEWNGAAYSAKTALVYVNSVDWCHTAKAVAAASTTEFGFGGGTVTVDPLGKASGWTTALDPVTGSIRWKVHMDSPMVAAVTPTAGGIVFTGTTSGKFLGLDASTGKTLYRHEMGGAMGGGIVTYRARGKQYVAATSGNSSWMPYPNKGKPTLVIFGL